MFNYLSLPVLKLFYMQKGVRIMDRSGKFAGENPFELARDWMDQAKE